MPSLSSRRRPWPYDLAIGMGTTAEGLMTSEGQLVGTKTQTLENVAPTVQDYSSAPVYKERTFAFRPRRGYGERVQSAHGSQRYHYGLNVWVSGGLFGKGPLTHTITPATTGSIRDFAEGLHGGTLAQFILAGASVLRRTNDLDAGQVVSETRAGQVATSAVRFKGAYVTPVDGLYVAWSDGALREYNGAAWVACTLPAAFLPQFVEIVGNELWAGDPTNNVVRKCTADPKLAASWGGPITPGQGSGQITCLRALENTLFIFKDDGGVFTLNGDGSDNDLFPGLRVTPATTNARTAQAGLDSIWFRMDTAFYRLTAAGGAVLHPVGPGRLHDNDSEVRGPVQAFAFWGIEIGFGALQNGANAYLLQYGDWQISEQSGSQYQFVDQWDGALVKWTGKTVTAMRISNIATPDSRLYVGFSDGTFDWIKLIINPFAASSGAEFTLANSKLYVPLHHAMFQADYKAYRGFSAFGPVLSTLEYVQIAYRTDTTVAYTSLGGSFTSTGQRLDTPENTVGKVIDVEISLVNTVTTASPVLEGIGLHESVRPYFQLDYSGTVIAMDRVAKRDGSTDRKTAEEIRALMRAAASVPGSVTMTLPDQVVQGLSYFGYQETLRPRKARAGLAWDIQFQATEFRTQTVYGTVDRLQTYSIDDLGNLSIDDLGFL